MMRVELEALLLLVWWGGNFLLLYPRERLRAYRRAQWVNQLGLLLCTISLWYGSLDAHVLSTYLCLYLLQSAVVFRRLRA